MRTEPVGVNMWTDDGEPRAAARASAFSIRFCATELAHDGDAGMGETGAESLCSRDANEKFACWQRKSGDAERTKPGQNCATAAT